MTEIARFAAWSDSFLHRYWEMNPGSALWEGYYKHDDVLPVPDAATREAEAIFLRENLKDLEGFDPATLDGAGKSDLAILKNRLARSLWYLEDFRQWQWDPSDYNVGSGFGIILNTDYKPLEERLQVISRRLDSVPAYYEAARENLTDPNLEHTALGLQQNRGALSLFTDRLPDVIASSSLPVSEKAEISEKIEKAKRALEHYIAWLEATEERLKKEGGRDFRIGAEVYEQKFAHDIVTGRSARELYELALTHRDELHIRMTGFTKTLWPKYLEGTPMPADDLVAVRQMIDHLSARHVEREGFIDEIRRHVPVITDFINEKGLVEIDPSRPLIVRETPLYQRGFSGASLSSPGPYNPTADSYYNVTPLDDYTEEEAESWLREYNHWILQILTIHEALPGHYTQLAYANKSPSLIKAIFGNGAMIEGWAVYTELMMLENGFGDHEPEMWLMYSKWVLRAVVNTILDYQIQVEGMEEDAAVEMMMVEAFQEDAEARGKWRRATVSQVQLTSYFSGFSEILALREEWKVLKGEDFDLREFHDKFLSYGNAPVMVIRELMLEEG